MKYIQASSCPSPQRVHSPTEFMSRMIPNPQIPPVLIAIRQNSAHAMRRKIWGRAFTASEIKGNHPSIVRRAAQLVEVIGNQLGDSKSGTVDMTEWISNFTFDFMGDMVFVGLTTFPHISLTCLVVSPVVLS